MAKPKVDDETSQMAVWIQSCFERDRVERFQLRSIDEQSESIMAEWCDEDWENQEPRTLATSMIREAHKHAEVSAGTRRYIIKAFKNVDGELTVFVATFFSLAGGAIDEPEDLGARAARHAVGLLGCVAEAVGRRLNRFADSAKAFSLGA